MTQKLIQIRERVWLWPHDRNPLRIQPCIGIIASDSGTVLIDAGNCPSLAKKLKAAMDKAELPAVSHIIYTHHHWDHVYGACEFDARVVAHRLCREALLEESKKPWSVKYLQDEVKKNPLLRISFRARGRLIEDWDTFRIVVPEIVFDDSMVIESGDMNIVLEHVGGEHAQDSIVVKVPSAGVMFLGDCFYPPPLHLREPDSDFSFPMLASLENEAYSLYVDGHNDPATRDDLLTILEQAGSDYSKEIE
jgi:glyoxylase-like metal-dependent hydrolase (beta-lactamase superfamily II)